MSRLRNIIRVADDFISLLFPRVCQGCGTILVRNEEVICLGCLADMAYTNYHLEPANALEKELWGRCYVERAAAMCFYRRGSRIQKIIHRLKYHGVRNIGEYMGRMYGRKLAGSEFVGDIDLVIPVPLHHSKIRKRGFNQSELIAGGLAGELNLPLEAGLLKRVARSATQTRRSRVERWENVEGIFSVSRPELLEGRHILLVDDVITTGSTVESCVNSLKTIDGVRVTVLALASAVMSYFTLPGFFVI